MTIIPIHWLWGELRLTWPYLTLKDKKTNQEVAIPRTIKLSIWEDFLCTVYPNCVSSGSRTPFMP